MTNYFSNMNMLNLNSGYRNLNPLNMLFSGNNFLGGCNSLFTKCNGEINYDAMAGFHVGQALINTFGTYVSHVVKNKKDNSAESVANDISDIKKEIDSRFTKLGIESAQELNSVEPAEKFTSALNSAKQKVLNYNTELGKLVEPTKPTDTSNTEEVAKYNKALADYNTEKERLTNLLKNAQTEEAEAQKALDAEKARIEALVEETRNYIAMLENAQEVYDLKILNEYDGNSLTRISDEKYNDKFKKDNSGKTSSVANEDAEFTRADLKRAIYKYRKAPEEDRALYKNQFATIYNYLSENNSDEITSDMEAAKKIILG